MDLQGMADPAALTGDGLTGLVFGIIRIIAFGGLGFVLFGLVLALLCDLCEGHRLKQGHGRTETWPLMP
jgi:hypothetical protein